MATSPSFCRRVSSSESSWSRRLESGERGAGTGEAGGGEQQWGEEEAEEGTGVMGTTSREAERELLGWEEEREGWKEPGDPGHHLEEV